jgi:pimeloyl-ACP methyl ester carboxylesterase
LPRTHSLDVQLELSEFSSALDRQSPVMVVAGDHDFTSVEATAEIFRSLPHGELFLVPGTGHGTFQSRPELVNLAVKEFLDGPDDASMTH